jgi:hypothetical protein
MGVVPKLAKHFAEWASLTANSITKAMMSDDSVGPDEIIEGDDYIMGTLETAGKVYAAGGLQTKTGSGADILIARLTAAFGDPATLPNGSMYFYTETTSNPDKIYLVVVMTSVFWVEELTVAAAA